MLLHKNNKFVYDNRAAIELPDNIYLDPCPDPCPTEGMVLYSEDQLAKVEIHFVNTKRDAETFLKESTEVFDSFQCTKPVACVKTNGIDGFTVSYTTNRFIYEEYVFVIPGEEQTLLNICFEQKKNKPANQEIYAKMRDELITKVFPA